MCTAPSIPKPQPIAPPPTAQSPDVVAARNNQRKRAALVSGRQGTILTGPSGVLTEAPTLNKTLLGS